MKDSVNPSKNVNNSHQEAKPHPLGARLTRQLFLWFLTVSLVYVFMVLGSQFSSITANADPTPTPSPYPTCTVTVTPTPSPTVSPEACVECNIFPPIPNPQPSPALTPIPTQFQPPSPDDTILKWRIFKPSGTGPWPGILLIHGGGFRAGDEFGAIAVVQAADLVNAGYYVAIPTYRLAPCGLIQGQSCHVTDDNSGRAPSSALDLEAVLRALRADSNTSGKKVGVVGGSSGGSHGAYLAFDTRTSTGWPNWSAADRPDAAVCLSGNYDFSDRTHETYTPDPLLNFVSDVENYTNTGDLVTQKLLSPVYLVTAPTQTVPFRPCFFINSRHDFMPYHQIVDVICALQSVGLSEANGDFKTLTVPNNHHSFDLWDDWDGITPVGDAPAKEVVADVIEFLDAHLK